MQLTSRAAFLISLAALGVLCVTAKKEPPAAPGPTKTQTESVIEEVTAKQLERMLNDKDFVAVFWCQSYF